MSTASVTSASLNARTKQLLVDLQEYVRSQKSLWQQVPWLALEADGRSGYSETYQTAWNKGYLPISISAVAGGYVAFIDLSNGEILNVFDTEKKPNTTDLLTLLSDIDLLDAKKVIANLKARGKEGYQKSYRKSKQEEWRRKTRRTFNVRKIFTRK